jgi:hypothetical protein
MDRSGYHTDFESGKIFKEEWMLYQDQESREFVPDRTYGDTVYYGGISDHLPVYVKFFK